MGAAIDAAGMTSVVWDTGAFPVGSTLLERIESFADDFEGAVLLFTPDVISMRGGQTAREPVSNVMFEYGYLSARLTRQRVAICLFEDVALPSDLQGVKVMNAGAVGYRTQEGRGNDYSTPKLPANLIHELGIWLESLPCLAEISLQSSSFTDTPEHGESRLVSICGAVYLSPRQMKSFGTVSHPCSSRLVDAPERASCMDLPTLTGQGTVPGMTS
jgi:CAP12/Pycsar effector protein, TIR domain